MEKRERGSRVLRTRGGYASTYLNAQCLQALEDLAEEEGYKPFGYVGLMLLDALVEMGRLDEDEYFRFKDKLDARKEKPHGNSAEAKAARAEIREAQKKAAESFQPPEVDLDGWFRRIPMYEWFPEIGISMVTGKEVDCPQCGTEVGRHCNPSKGRSFSHPIRVALAHDPVIARDILSGKVTRNNIERYAKAYNRKRRANNGD